jgi:tetraacyldisaccharide 4'-kinase
LAKIISVGNISLGGTGKTPMVIKLGEYFIHKGYKTAVISMGYKGKIGYGFNLISDGKNILLNPPLAADEPYLIAIKLKKAVVATCRDRNLAYKIIYEKFKPDIVLLDDAFQHRKIERDVDIVLLDYQNPISTGFIFPFGYLRQTPSSLRKADIVVFTNADENCIIPEKVINYVYSKPVFFAKKSLAGVFLNNNLFNYLDKEFFVFSGLANNRNFINFLTNQNINVAGYKGFSDHHDYTTKDFLYLKKMLLKYKADLLLTTEKDFVKLDDELKKITAAVQIETEIIEEEKFFKFISNKLLLTS